ncbi:MAG: thiol-disulfide oxidoreductase DCC family protein [Oscillochloridaceae bacterium umkhey_bin13]
MHTSRYTMLYDGACRICTNQAELVASYNDADWIEILDLNDPRVRERFPQITPAMAQRELHLVAPDGSLHQGAEAVREVLLRLPSLRGLGELMRLPGAMTLARPVYAWVAANRYLLGGRTEPCDDGSCAR